MDEQTPMCLYGDPTYPLRDQLLGPFKGALLTEEQRGFNKRMSAVRECVEWQFSKIVTTDQLSLVHNFRKMLKNDWTNGVVVCTVDPMASYRGARETHTPHYLLGKELDLNKAKRNCCF